jgi:transposase-like protein
LTTFSGIVALSEGDLLLAFATVDFSPMSTSSTYTLIYLLYLRGRIGRYNMTMDMRPQRALQIVTKEGNIALVSENTFRVKSQSHEGSYLVSKIGADWRCECPDFTERQTPCKHIYAVSFYPSLKLRVPVPVQVKPEVKPSITIESETPKACVYCQSEIVVKRGFVHEKGKNVQRFWCKACNKTFVLDFGFKKMKNDPKAITAALDAYFRGLSLRDVTAHLEQFYGVKVCESTVLRWIEKYTKVISEYVNTLSPQLSENWHADEVFVKMRGADSYKTKTGTQVNLAFLWNAMDRRTRFLVASKVSKARDVGGAAGAFQESVKNANGSEPERIFTDSLAAYSEGITFAPFTKDPEHIANSGIKKPHATNNRIERLNGTVRERTKVQRGWKSMKTSIPEGHRVFYNFLRPHMALDEQTPAQAAGLT